VCSLPSDAANRTAGEVFVLSNNSGSTQNYTLKGGTAGRWQGMVSQVTLDSGSSLNYSGLNAYQKGNASAEQRLEQMEQQLNQHQAAMSRAATALSGIQLRMAAQNAVYSVGNTDVWHDFPYDNKNGTYGRDVNATLRVKTPLPNGGQLHIWVDTNQNGLVSDNQVNFLANQFANTIYPMETELIGAPWGPLSASAQTLMLPDTTKDVHLVLTSLNNPTSISGLQGYVAPINLFSKASANLLQNDPSCANGACDQLIADIRNSNEALVTFLNLDTLIDKNGATQWSGNVRGAKGMFFTLAHEYQHMLYSYYKRYRLGAVPSTVPTTWENELASQTIAYLIAAAVYPDGKGGLYEHPSLGRGEEFDQFLSEPACDLKAWTPTNYSCQYPKALAAGMLMMHQYGPKVLKPWVTGTEIGEKALNKGLQAVSGGNYSRLMQRLSASLAMAGITPFPSGYGFPAKSVTVAGRTINLPQVALSASAIKLADNGETYTLPLSLGNDTVVSLPPYSHLSIVKQP